MTERPVEVILTSVFAEGDGGGNPCPVVLDAHELGPAEMRAVAQHFGQESGFVVSGPDESVPRLRYFVPQHEMSMCVHATVAVVGLLVRRGRLSGGHAVVDAPVGAIAVEWSDVGDGELPRRVGVRQLDPEFAAVNPTPEAVASALNVRTSSLEAGIGPVRSVSVSRPKLIVPLSDVDTLDALAPSWEELWQLCEAHQTTGVYAVAAGPGPDVWFARQFPVRAGYPEDAATGVAAGAFAGYLLGRDRSSDSSEVSLTIHQGRAMGRPSVLSVSGRREGDRITDIRVSGGVDVRGSELIDAGALTETAS